MKVGTLDSLDDPDPPTAVKGKSGCARRAQKSATGWDGVGMGLGWGWDGVGMGLASCRAGLSATSDVMATLLIERTERALLIIMARASGLRDQGELKEPHRIPLDNREGRVFRVVHRVVHRVVARMGRGKGRPCQAGGVGIADGSGVHARREGWEWLAGGVGIAGGRVDMLGGRAWHGRQEGMAGDGHARLAWMPAGAPRRSSNV